MFRHTDTVPLVLSPVDSDPETDMIDNKSADRLALQYNKSFSEFSFSKSPAQLAPPSLPGGQAHRSCPDLASLPRAEDDTQVRLIAQGRDEGEDILSSRWGELSVTREGATRGPFLLTLHDIGLDYKSNFQVRICQCEATQMTRLSRFSSHPVTWRAWCRGFKCCT